MGMIHVGLQQYCVGAGGIEMRRVRARSIMRSAGDAARFGQAYHRLCAARQKACQKGRRRKVVRQALQQRLQELTPDRLDGQRQGSFKERLGHLQDMTSNT